eukprot:GFUD01016525.1.p1 GENE.GFUD01016525.1~~GFUD01016525.1.p1  ORF type:complete len:349 (-),score=107.55 GFUD01016525.1:103-1149(-)
MSPVPSPAPVTCSSAQSQTVQAATKVSVANKIFVSGLMVGEEVEEQLMKLFSGYGEVTEVVVDGSCATVTFQEEEVARQVEMLQTVPLGGRKITIARVLEEKVEAPIYEAEQVPYNTGPTPYPYQDIHSSSYPSYQPAYQYPVWYPVAQAPYPYYDQAITDCGPVQPQQCLPALPAASNHFSVPPPTPINGEPGIITKSVFSFDTLALSTQLDQQKTRYPSAPPTRPNMDCCHVCSAPSVQGVAPLGPPPHLLPGPVHYPSQSYGHQLQPLTPITPSLHSGYMIPPTPTPTNLPPMTPTYYLPPTPTPSYMMYNPHGHPLLVADTVPPTAPSTAVPPPTPYTKVKFFL